MFVEEFVCVGVFECVENDLFGIDLLGSILIVLGFEV